MLDNPPSSKLPSSTRSRWPGPRLGHVPHPARAFFPSAGRAAGTAPDDFGAQATLAAVMHQERVFLLRGLMELSLPASSESSLDLSFHHSNQAWVSPATEAAVRTDCESQRKPRTQPCPPPPCPAATLACSPWRPAPRAACSPSSCGPPLQEILGSPSLVSSRAHYTPWATSPCLSAPASLGSRVWLDPSPSLTVLGYGGRSKLTPQRQRY